MEEVEVAIVGAGQAGLATSWHLKQAGVEHVILESGRVAETWRSRRWDSFCLVTPNWAINLPGVEYKGADPDGYMHVTELVDFFQRWADSFGPPVENGCEVTGLDRHGDGFLLQMQGRELRAQKVVVASGAYQKAHRPAGAESLPKGLHQVLAEEYGNPDRLPPGNVLIIGSGQTGCQLSEELHETGRRVYLACGRCPWAQRRIGGHDLVWWLDYSGFAERTPDQLPSTAARLVGNPLTTGHGGGRDLHYRTLLRDGVELLGRFMGADDGRVHFADDLADSVDFGDARWADLRKWFDAHAERVGTRIDDYDIPPPLRIKTRTELDLEREGITSVIFTSGYRPEYRWVNIPVFDDMGFPIQTDGRSSVAGLYFVGVHWLRKNKSAILWGAGEDAEVVAGHVVEDRR
jgi:putative flavoprotein involved in K+ transport